MSLDYLDFDYSEDAEGIGVFDAMASVAASRLPALHAEIAQVLGWAHEHFPARGAVGEEGDWDCDLTGLQERTSTETLHFDPDSRRLQVDTDPVVVTRHTVSLSISGTPAFCEAFKARFAAD